MKGYIFYYISNKNGKYGLDIAKNKFINYNNKVNGRKKHIPNTITKNAINNSDYHTEFMKLLVLKKACHNQEYKKAKELIEKIDKMNVDLKLLSIYNIEKAKEWFKQLEPNNVFSEEEYIKLVSDESMKLSKEVCNSFKIFMEGR